MSFDPEAHRRASLENWEAAAPGWVRRAAQIRSFSAPVSHWMVEAIAPQPGQRVLELAAGTGETGMLAAELVAPIGTVVISDQAEGMLAGARERAAELGLANVEFLVINAEWIDLPLASVDAILCRWGLMLMADPAAALSECRRVLRPGGRIAVAVWDELAANPWAALPGRELVERGLAPAPATEQPPPPGPFALGDRARLQELLEDAGFTEVTIDAVEVRQRHEDFSSLWETQLDISRNFHDAVLSRPAEEIAEIEASLVGRLAPYTLPSGAIELPGRTLVALAEA